jgi:tetratricopeptide (TPR) repeat protein
MPWIVFIWRILIAFQFGRMFKKLLFVLVVLTVTSQAWAARPDETLSGHYFEPLASDDVATLLDKGHAAVKTHEDEAALRNYQIVLKKGKPGDCVFAYIGIGSIYGGKKNYPLALDNFAKAIALDKKIKTPLKDVPDPYRGRAKVYLAMGNLDAALADMNSSFKYGSTDGRLAERGTILFKLKRYNEAAADYTAGIKMSPKDPHPYYDRARCYEMLGMHAEAARDRAAGNKATNDMF